MSLERETLFSAILFIVCLYSCVQDYLGQLVASTDLIGENANFWVGAKNIDGTWQWIENGQPVDNIIL